MHKISAVQRWEVEISDVQGKLSNLYLWPGTLTTAFLKFQVIRGDVIEHEEITPFFDVSGYEVRCNYRFVMDVPVNCSHIHLFFISGDIHPVSGKPKLIARSRLSFKDICRHVPLDKYFTLYRRDRVTQNCIAGGHVRLGFFRHRRRGNDDEFVGDRSSMDHVSVISSARDETFPQTNPFEQQVDSLPPRPASAVSRMLIAGDIQSVSESEEAFESRSSFGDTERSTMGILSQWGQTKQLEGDNPRASSSNVDRTSRDTEDQLLSVASKLSERSGDEGDQPSSRRGHSNIHPWFGILFGATLGVIGTVAVFTLRYLSRRNSKKRRAKKGIVCH